MARVESILRIPSPGKELGKRKGLGRWSQEKNTSNLSEWKVS